MWSLRAALSFHGLMTLSTRSITAPPHGELAVWPRRSAFGLCQDGEKRRIALCYPMAESKTANEDGDTGQDGVEEIEGSHRSDADKVEQCAFHAQVGERLMQALEDSICAGGASAVVALAYVLRLKMSERWPGSALYAPEPTQNVHSENSNARSGGDAGQRFFCPGFTVGEAIAAEHGCNQACNLRNGAGEEGLDRVKAGVER